MYVSIDLEQLREKYGSVPHKQPYPHQVEAFDALSNTFKPGSGQPRSGILVLPTGAGKTFTAVCWLYSHVVPKQIKILWLAPSFHLLDQAFKEFYQSAKDIDERRRKLNVRCVSSNPSHAEAHSIQLTDDIVIITIPTAINNLNTKAVDNKGFPVKTAFRRFVEGCQNTELFVVVDEAHHTPAYGCRSLLISENTATPGLRYIVPKLSLLGLTATPTYNDKARRGWLGEIFKDGIIYSADKTQLIAQNILANPNYIEMSTGRTFEVDDQLYNRLVKQHKDLPEDIIEKLANDNERNSFIVRSYLDHKDRFGKTIIFCDRWYQCVYIQQKLVQNGVRADSIYSHIDADPGSAEARNKRTQDDNKRILEQFKTDKDEHGNYAPLDVLLNVRMLTEGADVPSVKTVFITRQTTSPILMTQMVGRALRGEKAGGSAEANIVLFFDDWKRLIDWANPQLKGDVEEAKPVVKGSYPYETISIQLVEELARAMELADAPPMPFSAIMPVGWYKTEIVYADADQNQDSMEGFTEFILIYEHTKPKFSKFINFLANQRLPEEWSSEQLDEQLLQQEVEQWIKDYFDIATDNIGDKLNSDLIKIARHIAQNQEAPSYHSFEARDQYDIGKLAEESIKLKLDPIQLYEFAKNKFDQPGCLWPTFYKSFYRFKSALDLAIIGVIQKPQAPQPPNGCTGNNNGSELTKEQKNQVKQRDNFTCLACGVKTNAKYLQVDHIKPLKVGGETSIENSQTLCAICNNKKGINEINFRLTGNQLNQAKPLDQLFAYEKWDEIRSLTRVINFFYHCRAVKRITWHDRRDSKFGTSTSRLK